MLGFLLGFLWLAALKAWLAGHVALDADSLVVADVWNSLHMGGHLGGWVMGPHPYVFPDLAVYALAARCAPDLVGRQIYYGLIQGFLLWLFLARLLRQLCELDGSRARAYAAAGLLLLLACFSEGNSLGEALIPGYHGGALLCCLGFLAWSLRQARLRSAWPSVLGVSCLVGLIWASDQVTPLWALIPGLALSVGLDGPARRRVWGAAGLSFLVRGLVLGYWEHAGMAVAHFRWSYFWGHGGIMLGALGFQWLPALDAACWPVLLGGLALLLLLGGARRGHAVYAWFALAVLLTALSGLGLALLESSMQGRYFLAFTWLSVPLVPLLLAQRLQGSPLPLLAAVLLGLLCWSSLVPDPSPPALRQAFWLDQQTQVWGLKRGLAGYFYARPLRLLSRQGLSLEPVDTQGGALEPYAWMADRRAFVPDQRVQFVVLNGLDAGTLRAALGPPFEQLNGEGLSVWIYSRPLRPGAGRLKGVDHERT